MSAIGDVTPTIRESIAAASSVLTVRRLFEALPQFRAHKLLALKDRFDGT